MPWTLLALPFRTGTHLKASYIIGYWVSIISFWIYIFWTRSYFDVIRIIIIEFVTLFSAFFKLIVLILKIIWGSWFIVLLKCYNLNSSPFSPKEEANSLKQIQWVQKPCMFWCIWLLTSLLLLASLQWHETDVRPARNFWGDSPGMNLWET